MLHCLYCNSKNIHKNGRLESGGQRWKCIDCQKQFSIGGSRDTYSPNFKKQVIDQYCHSPSGVKDILKKYKISSRTLVKRKKQHIDFCPICKK